ncbi:MAG TPA: hypothetical protein VH188_11705 [Chthoniobacterales bacterium]|jgi:hypothetical protein|nr:hypothetical protein [Chthoniobacterales bacterium]
MNDFSELETELKKLRPRSVSPDLNARIEVSLAEEAMGRGTATAGVLPKQSRFRLNWFALGLGLAAAATFLILARVNVDRPSKSTGLAMLTPAPITPAAKAVDSFVPSAMTQVLYDTKDEGLHFTDGQNEPMRRLRSRKRETVQWKNPQTGASLRVSYPTEEVTLVPISGQ